MAKKIFWFIVLLGVLGVFYLSWLPQSRLENYWFIPKFIAKWSDAKANENIRTAVPFIFIGGFMGFWLKKRNKSFRFWLLAWIFNLIVVIIAEVGQLFIANRTCDIGDVIWGAVGAFAGLIIAFFGGLIALAAKNIHHSLIKKSIGYGKEKGRPLYG